jgi:amino acid adenylation domain-containing protein
MGNRKIPGRLVIAANQKTRERAYWLNQLSGDLTKSIFPYDQTHREDNRKKEAGKRNAFPFTWEGDLYSGLLKLSTGSDVKLHIILVAALTALLEKYTPNSHSDIIVGTPIHKQRKQGEFINTVLPLRNPVKTGMSFKELLLQARQTMIEASKNQGYPIEVLLDELDMDPYAAHFPLFDVVLLLENIQEQKDIRHINVNVVFTFSRTAESIHATIDYNPFLYEKTTVERMALHFTQLLRQVLAGIDTPLPGIDILSPGEKKQLLIDFNNTDAPFPMDKTIHELFEEQAERAGDRVAVIGMEHGARSMGRRDGIGTMSITYRELNKKANRLAHELRLQGVGPNTIAAIILEPSIDMIAAILAILKTGSAYLPIDQEYPEERIISILNDSGATRVITRTGIMRKYSYTALQGLKYTRAEPHMTEVRAQSDFDRIPHPDRTLIDFEKYSHYIGHAMVRHAVSIQGTRGCPFLCAYCHRTMQKKNVARSAENIFEEVEYYYDRGVRRFSFVDEIFNINAKNSTRFFQLILENKLDVQLFFPNGMRADRLTRDYIDLMVEAGTVNVGLALETASPRLQKLIKKNLDIDKLRENAEYFCSKYPQVIVELFTMHGFPTETEEEAMSTLHFIKSLKWIHFPYVFLLKIHPSTDMMQLALESGISPEAIERSMTAAFHEIPETLPFPKSFTRQYVARFINEYFLSRERLLHVLPYQMKIATEKELVGKYDGYLPAEIKTFDDIIANAKITREELGSAVLLQDDSPFVPDYSALRKSRSIVPAPKKDAFRILLLDLSVLFSSDKKEILHGEITEPLGLMYLLTYLRETFKERIDGKMVKAKIDFDSYEQLKPLVCDFKPHLIGIRTLSYFKDFFHRTVSLIKGWGIEAAIIAGGPYGTSDYKLVLQDPNVDLTVLKEGELTLAELVEKMMANGNKLPAEEVLDTIDGIAFIPKKDRDILRKSTRELVRLDEVSPTVSRHPVQNPGPTAGPGDLLYLIATSGSTGKPKCVMLEHRNLVNLIHFEYSRTPIDFNRVLQFASIGFDVSVQEIFSTLLAGGELYLTSIDMKSDVQQLFDYIRQHNIEVVFLPPAFVRFIFSNAHDAAEFPRTIKHIITAGEQLIVNDAFRQYLEENRVVLHNHYGPSETHVVTTLTLDPDGPIVERPSIGHPISNTRIYILDEAGNPKPLGAAGELYIAGANVGRGYYNDDALTAEKFIDPSIRGPLRVLTDESTASGESDTDSTAHDPTHPLTHSPIYRTGDLARWLPDGSIEFIGRVDEQVKIRGYRIEPVEVERALLEITAVKDAVVIDRTDANGDKYLCAYLVSPENLDTTDLRDVLSLSLPDYMIPAYFVQIDRIPLTPNGKTDRKALPMPRLPTGVTYEPPEGELENRLAALWADVLSVEQSIISADINFFELGGHSLKATILISRIHKELNIKMNLGDIFKHPTIRELAGRIKESEGDRHRSIKPVEDREYYHVSSAQHRLYVIYQMDPESCGYNMPTFLPLHGAVDMETFEKSFKTLIERHESLRTSFFMLNEEPVQQIHKRIDFKIEDFITESVRKQGGGTSISARGPDVTQIKKNFIRPFDLSQAPLLRVGLTKMEGETHLLMVDMHHIITDGTSIERFVKEFMASYTGESLPPLNVRYRDFSQWQNRRKGEKAMKMQEAYWLKQFEEEAPVLELPLDYPRPIVRSFEGSTVHFEISPGETETLNQMARESGVTLYMVLEAVYTVFLAKICSQEDIVVGTPVKGRRHTDLEGVIGMFVNMLPLRNRPAGGKTFWEFLLDVKEQTPEAFENQDYPFEDLVEKVVTNRDTSRNPLFDVIFAFQDIDIDVEAETGRLMQWEPGDENRVAKFDLSLHAVERDTLSFVFEYSTTIFEKETILRFSHYFKRVISSVSGNPRCQLQQIEMLPEEEKHRLLTDFNNTAVGYPAGKTIHRLFEEQVERTPDHTALVGKAGRMEAAVHVTYTELNRKSGHLAHLLQAKGVKPGNIIGFMMKRSTGMVVGLLGILKAGGAYLPIEPGYPAERIDFMLKDSHARVLVTTREDNMREGTGKQGGLASLYLPVEADSTIPGTSTEVPIPQCPASPGNLAYIIYTSGTTGKPKGMMIEHKHVVRLLFNDTFQFDFGTHDVWTLFHSICFDFSVWEVYGALLYGGKLVIISREVARDPRRFMDILEDQGVTVLNQTPSAFYNLMETVLKEEKSLLPPRYVIFGGEALKPAKLKKWKTRFPGTRLINMYGITETTVHVTYKEIGDREIDRGISSIGTPIPTLSLYIMHPQMGLQPPGTAGECCVGGEGVGRGYLNRPERTHEKFVYNPYNPGERLYRSGDRVRRLNNGEIEYMDRIDHQVKIRGFRIEAGEIETQLLNHHQVKETVVTAGEDANNDRYLCAYIVPAETAAFDNPLFITKELRAYLSGKLPGYMIPAYFVPLDEIPLTSNRKVDRAALPRPQPISGEVYAAPRNETEAQLAVIWSGISARDLSARPVGIDDNFFNIGGDSIKAIRVVSRINRQWNSHLKLVDLYTHGTIRELSGLITSTTASAADTPFPLKQEVLRNIEALKNRIKTGRRLPEGVEDIYPMSDIEKGMVFYYLKDIAAHVYHDQFVYRMKYRGFESRRFKQALTLLVEKHEILRTCFNMEDVEEPVQLVHRTPVLDLEYSDITGMEPSQQESHIRALVEEDRKHPFNIAVSPLWRMKVFTLNEEEICILFVCHHAILDGWSIASFWIELHNTYLELKSNPRFVPPKLNCSYKEVVIEEQVEKQNRETTGYWQKELEDYKRVDFPGPRGKRDTHGAARVETMKLFRYQAATERLEQLNRCAVQYDTSVRNLCIAAYIYTVNMIAYGNDITVGVVTNNRPASHDGDKILGCFLNTVPVRINIPTNISWKEYTRLVETKMLEVKKYERLPLFEIARLIGERNKDRNPIFDTLINFTDFHVLHQARRDEGGDRSGSVITGADKPIPMDGSWNTNTLFDFEMDITTGRLMLGPKYNPSAISDEMVKSCCIYFERILNMFVEAPGGSMKKDAVIPETEKQELLKAFNDTAAGYSQHKTLHRLFEDRVEKSPDHIAVNGPVSRPGPRTMTEGDWELAALTYRELNQKSNQLAHALRGRGAGSGSLIAVIMERAVEMVTAVLGILKAGGAYVPLEPHLPALRVRKIMDSLQIQWTLTTSANHRDVQEIETIGEREPMTRFNHLLCLDQEENIGLPGYPVENPFPLAASEDIAYIIFTSGSTGTPKGVVVNHRPVVNVIEWVNRTFGISPGDKQLFITSLGFDLSVYDIFGILAAGAVTRVVPSRDIKDPRRLLHIIMHEGITFWDSAPAAMQQLTPFFHEISEWCESSQLRLVFLSGDWIPVTLPDVLRETFASVRVISLGGATEAAIWSNYYPIGVVEPGWPSIPYGKPIQNAGYYILDPTLDLCPTMVPGDLYIGGQCLASGYMNDLLLTAEKFIKNPFAPGETLYKTGDIARWFEDGNMEFLGRKDQQVKVRGFRIELGEIESQLSDHEAIGDAVVLARKDTHSDNYLCAYFTAHREMNKEELKNHLSVQLPEYMIPSYFIQLEHIPVTPNGKLDRKALPEPESGLSSPGTGPLEGPRDMVEEALVSIWVSVLGIEKDRIGIDGDFFELGGHSLNATTIISRIHKELNVKVPLAALFNGPTIRELSRFIRGAAEDTYASIEPTGEKEYHELSFNQERLWFIHQVEPQSPAYNMTGTIRFDDEADETVIKKTLRAIIQRHETFRTSFKTVNGRPYQFITKEDGVPLESFDLSSLEEESREQREEEIASRVKQTPFDLTRAPLFRAALIKTNHQENGWELVFAMHHIISDGWSLEILKREFYHLYDIYREGKTVKMESLPIQYKDFAAWHNRYLNDPAVKEKSHGYWLKVLESHLPRLELPNDYRDTYEASDSAGYRFSMNEGVRDHLKQVGEAGSTTLFMVVFSAFNLLLSRLSGQDTIVCGIPAAGREHNELQEIMGFFVNTVILKNTVDYNDTFTDFLEQINQTTLEALEHQMYPLERVLDDLKMKFPGIPVFFNMLNINTKSIKSLPELEISTPFTVEKVQDAKFPLVLYVKECRDGIDMACHYRKRLFSPERVEYMMQRYSTILKAVAGEPGKPLREYVFKKERKKYININKEGIDAHEAI